MYHVWNFNSFHSVGVVRFSIPVHTLHIHQFLDLYEGNQYDIFCVGTNGTGYRRLIILRSHPIDCTTLRSRITSLPFDIFDKQLAQHKYLGLLRCQLPKCVMDSFQIFSRFQYGCSLNRNIYGINCKEIQHIEINKFLNINLSLVA